MIDRQVKEAIGVLAAKGMGSQAIADAVHVGRNTVRRALKASRGKIPRGSRLDEHLSEIRSLYEVCRDARGRVNWVRVWEKLRDQRVAAGLPWDVSYSALTWFCRKQGIGVKEKVPAGVIVTGPGEEMQHDTSPYVMEIAGKKVQRQCASLVLGYSRMIYVQFLERFDRFWMKVFLTEAFRCFGGVCGRCVIDNTSVALACGSGSRAQVAAEVEAFEERFGFRFMAHEIMDSDRKGKVERPFHFVETNFLVGRTFKDDEDLNRQAMAWAENANRRRIRDLRASPLELFVSEKQLLKPLPVYIPEVYRIHRRMVDSYGCVSLDGLKYPAPPAMIDRCVMVRETKDRVILEDGGAALMNHTRKHAGVDPILIRHPDVPRRRPASVLSAEEDKLRALGPAMSGYLDALKSARGVRYAWCVRRLWRLLCQYRDTDLMAAVVRAREHRLFDIHRVETILLQTIADQDFQLPAGFEAGHCDENPEYQRGAVTPAPRLSDYIPDPPQGDDHDP